MKLNTLLITICVIITTPLVGLAGEAESVKVGYEILQRKSFNKIVVWATQDITREEFDALKLPFGWLSEVYSISL
jgi:hypothetical protein